MKGLLALLLVAATVYFLPYSVLVWLGVALFVLVYVLLDTVLGDWL